MSAAKEIYVNVPKVSITMPTYNGARYIKGAIDSILPQSFSDFELLVLVDGSSDNTLKILGDYSDSRISVIIKKENEGLPAALNTGLDSAKGEYWTWTSDDNLYLQDTLKVMVDYLDSNPASSLVSPYLYHINEAGTVMSTTETDYNCFLCRRADAIMAGKFRKEFMLVEDADFFIRMQHYNGPIARIRKPYYKFRDHENSLSSTQIQKRQYISVMMHHDLITRGIEKGDLRELFFDRLKTAALFHGHQWMDKIVEFARGKGLPFYESLSKASAFYKTTPGWTLIKLNVAIGGRVKTFFASLSSKG